MRIRRRPPRAFEIPTVALNDPMALVTALSAARLAAGMRVGYWSHEQVDQQLIAADALLRALDPGNLAEQIAS